MPANRNTSGAAPSALTDHDLSRLLLENLATGVFSVDVEGRFTFVNAAACRLFGFASPQSVLGQDSHALTEHGNEHGVRYDVVECPIHRVMVTGQSLEIGTDTFRRIDGSPFFARFYAAPLADAAGDTCGAVVAIEDITESLLRERTLTQYKAVFQASRDAILLHDRRVIVECNPASLLLFGAQATEDLIGLHPGACSPEHQPDGRPSREAADAYTEQALAEGSVAYEWLCQALDGHAFHSEILLSRVDLPEGPFLQAVIRDISERRRAERALQRSQSELAAAQEIAHLGNWTWDVGTGAIVWSDEVFRIFGVEVGQHEPTYEGVLDYVHPEDRTRVAVAVADALRGQADYDIEHRIVRPDGSLRTVHQRARVVRDMSGQPLRMRGTVQDVTERRQLEDQLRYERDLGATVLDGLPAIFFLLDRYRNPVRWNRNLESVTGAGSQQVPGGDVLDFVDPADRQRVASAIALALQEGSAEIEAGLRTAAGDTIPYFFTGNRVELGGATFLAGFGVDISERKRLERELARQASHDHLTGLYNRLKFEELLELECERSRRYRTQFAVVMFDIDHFKQVNDDFGHDVGDRVLKRVADIVGQQIRRTDSLARWGGEEFMLLLPQTDLGHAVRIAEAARRRVDQASFPGPGRLTISLGVAEYQADETVSALFKRVDKALYEAKQTGRNRTVAA